ncbi:hypothetical protein O3P69_003423 [Scylla paramamosain]|uniref:Sodium-dependent nutrient amino acid transporter 1 n=1 Tax=Scylla paramamosain TaxID=85552 RepID=A0AAW0UKW6_SCYPA
MLRVTGTTWEDMGDMQWELVGLMALAWLIVGTCLARGIRTTGNIVYFTALFPYAVMIILFIREGAYRGLEFYILKPNVTRLMEIEVWSEAAVQIFFSLGVCFGSLITLSSYNKFTNNCMSSSEHAPRDRRKQPANTGRHQPINDQQRVKRSEEARANQTLRRTYLPGRFRDMLCWPLERAYSRTLSL